MRLAFARRRRSNRHFVVCKGSPEAIGERLVDKPEGYDKCAMKLAMKGLRVISLCYKQVGPDAVETLKKDRGACEEKLKFAGFIAFTCRVRKDTKQVLQALKEGGLSITMVTGDNLLTAAHVAKEVAICRSDDTILMLEEVNGDDDADVMIWRSYKDGTVFGPFVAEAVPNLAKKYDLAVNGKNLAKAFLFDENTKKVLYHFQIFARMTPAEKETVIECLHSVGHICLMCGDGANDVGALKQADVGVALLSGFGDVNVDKGEDGVKKGGGAATSGVGGSESTALISQAEIDKIRALPVKDIKQRIRALGCEPDNFAITDKSELVALYRKKQIEIAVATHDKKNAADQRKENVAKVSESY